MPFFSIIVPTRNRPALFRDALESVLAQRWADIEVIVVNDGSAPEHRVEYASILEDLNADRVRSFDLMFRHKGHGGSFVRNFGAAQAKGRYLCFLDDDDCWIDSDHLRRAHAVITEADNTVDLYFTNQATFVRGQEQPGARWLGDLPPILAALGCRPDRQGAYTVTSFELLQSQGFAHLNTLIVRRELYEKIGGLEECIRWEHDRDLYLRLLDQADAIMKYGPVNVARHNVPDPATSTSVTTSLSEAERLLDQLIVVDRALYLSHQPGIRAYARRHKVYTLKRIAESLANAKHHSEAAFYAREALGAGPTVKWAGYTGWLTLRALLARD